MSAIAKCMISASQQFVGAALPAILHQQSRGLMAATLIALAATAGLSPSTAQAQQAYQWGSGASSNANEGVLPQQSAGRWGELLGSVAGRAAGVMLGGSGATSVIGRAAQEASAGIGDEIGRNVGRSAAQSPYTASKTNSVVAMPAYERDHLDTLGLRAIFANAEAVRAGDNYSGAGRDASDRYNQAQRSFELAMRSTADRGFPVTAWLQVRDALQQPLRAVPEARFADLARAMSERLQRPGGPGFVTATSNNTNSLESLRVSMQQRQQGGYAPRY